MGRLLVSVAMGEAIERGMAVTVDSGAAVLFITSVATGTTVGSDVLSIDLLQASDSINTIARSGIVLRVIFPPIFWIAAIGRLVAADKDLFANENWFFNQFICESV